MCRHGLCTHYHRHRGSDLTGNGRHPLNEIFWFITICALVVLMVARLGWLTYHGITLPRDTIQEVAEHSDLTLKANIDSRDEVGISAEAFNHMLASTRSLIEEITGSSSQVAAAAEELSVINTQTNQGISQQLTESEQVATAMNEMSSTVQEVARSAAEASGAAHEADNQAYEGSRIVGEVVVAIRELATEVQSTAGMINELNAESDNIGSVLDVIRGIAEQTNLPTLNTAIAAARAAEQVVDLPCSPTRYVAWQVEPSSLPRRYKK